MTFSSLLEHMIAMQVAEDPTLLPRLVREAYAEVFGEVGLDDELAKMHIDLSRYGHRAIWQWDPVAKKQTGAIVGIPDYKSVNDNDRIYFKVPREKHDELQLALDSKKIGYIPAKEVIQTREGTVHRSEVAGRAGDHLRLMEDYLVPLVGKRKAKKWIREQQASLNTLITGDEK